MSYKPKKGLVTERVLRGLIRSIARELMKKELSVREKIALLKEQARLAKELRDLAEVE